MFMLTEDCAAAGAAAGAVDGAIAGGIWPAPAEPDAAAAGCSSGALCTDLRGAGIGGVGFTGVASDVGGGLTAGMVTLAAGGVVDGGTVVPTPNRPGDSVFEDGSGKGLACSRWCAAVRSATSESVIFFNASISGAAGLAGTVPILG